MEQRTKLALLMDAQGITQVQMSKLTGIPIPTVNAHYNGKRVSRSNSLMKYAGALGVKAEDIYGWATESDNQTIA